METGFSSVVDAVPNDPPAERSGDLASLPPNLVRVPLVQQSQGFSCGAAATMMLLRYWCFDAYAGVDESELYEALETTSARGTEPEPMVGAPARRNGLDAAYRNGNVTIADLEHAVDVREPPIVDLQAWSDHNAPWLETWDAGHYVLLIGYDEQRLYFADPSRATPLGYAFLLRTELEARWHDLAGPHDLRVERMAIFVRGTSRWSSSDAPAPRCASRLG